MLPLVQRNAAGLKSERSAAIGAKQLCHSVAHGMVLEPNRWEPNRSATATADPDGICLGSSETG